MDIKNKVFDVLELWSLYSPGAKCQENVNSRQIELKVVRYICNTHVHSHKESQYEIFVQGSRFQMWIGKEWEELQ